MRKKNKHLHDGNKRVEVEFGENGKSDREFITVCNLKKYVPQKVFEIECRDKKTLILKNVVVDKSGSVLDLKILRMKNPPVATRSSNDPKDYRLKLFNDFKKQLTENWINLQTGNTARERE